MTEMTDTSANGNDAHPTEFRKALGLFDSTMLVAGIMVGSGIFIVSAEISRQVGSSGWLLATWVITGLLTVAGALSYGELAAMMPVAGGMYVYLREAFSPLIGFLYGWTLLSVIQTGSIAAVAVAFARFSGTLVPWVSERQYLIAPFRVLPGYALSLSTAQAVAILVVVAATAINLFGVQNGRFVQNVLTVAKLAGILGLLVLGAVFFVLHPEVLRGNFLHAWQPAHVTSIGFLSALTPFGLVVALCVSQTGSLFSSDSWHDVTLVASEVKNPRRNLPLALAIGTSMVTVLYLLCNMSYLSVLSLAQIQNAPGDRVATMMVAHVFPAFGAAAMGLLIVISTFGTVNALVLAGSRACYAMAQDGLFFRRTGTLNRYQVPGWALVLQGFWAICLVLPRTIGTTPGEYGNLYSNLLDYVISAALLFYIVTVLALFRLRRTRPELPRPYRVWGYPWLPMAYIAGSAVILVALFAFRTATTWPGLLIILSGVPVYFLFRSRTRQGAEQVL